MPRTRNARYYDQVDNFNRILPWHSNGRSGVRMLAFELLSERSNGDA